MKHSLLALTAAALLAAPVSAQVATSRIVPIHNGTVTVAPSLQLNTEVAKSLTPASVLGTRQLNQPVTRVAEDARPHKLLGYFVDGTEGADGLSLCPLGFKISDLTTAGYSGYGFAQAFYSDMLKRYVGNTITSINFGTWMGKFTNGQAFIADYTTGQFLWTSDIDDIQGPADSKSNIPINQVPCDYQITGKEGALLIGWVADAADVANDPYASKLGVLAIAVPDQTSANEGFYALLKKPDGSFVIHNKMNPWKNSSTGNTTYNQAYIKIMTDGDGSIKDNDADVLSLGNVRGQLNTNSATSNLTLANLGLDPLKSFDYKFEVGSQTKEGTYTFPKPIVFYNAAQVNLPALLNAEVGKNKGKFTITKVNTVDDEFTDDNSASNYVLTLNDGFYRVPVVEEFTNTECGYCPRGMAGMEMLNDKWGDKAVLIAAHSQLYSNTDPMNDASYNTVISNLGATGLPNAAVNRELSGDPYVDAPELADQVASQLCEAKMEVKASKLANKLTKNVTVNTKLNFTVTANEGDYGLAYVITEDGVTGADQLNYYLTQYMWAKTDNPNATDAQIFEQLGLSDYPYMQAVTAVEATKTAKDSKGNLFYYYKPTFNHVSRSITSPLGADTTVPATAAGSEVQVDATIPVPTSVVNRDNLKLAVLLIDRTSGVVVTGQQVKLNDEWTTGVDNATAEGAAQVTVADGAFVVKAAHAQAQVFSADGKLVSSATVEGEASLPTFGKGVYVVRVVENGHVTTQKAVF